VTFGFVDRVGEFGGARLGSGFGSIPGLEFVWVRLDPVPSVALLLPSLASRVSGSPEPCPERCCCAPASRARDRAAHAARSVALHEKREPERGYYAWRRSMR
jgi:hypothetical protein